MIHAPALTWQEPLATTSRRVWLRAEMREKVVGPHVLDQLRQERAERVKTASTIAADGAIEQEAGAQ